MNDIFISYKVHNRKTAIEYYKALKALDYQVWFDQLVPKNADWKKTIASQIENSRLMICLLSKACLLDDWVLFQLKMAKFYQKVILYILLDDTPWEEHLEYEVSKLAYHSLEEISLRKWLENEAIDLEEEAPANEEIVNDAYKAEEAIEEVIPSKSERVEENYIPIEAIGDVILSKETAPQEALIKEEIKEFNEAPIEELIQKTDGDEASVQEALVIEETIQDTGGFAEADIDIAVFEDTVHECSPIEEAKDIKEKEEPIKVKKGILKPILNIGLMVIFTALAFLFYGVKILNISLDYRYGCILVGITLILILSYIHKRVLYFIQAILAIGLLCVTIFLVPPYYISSVSINSMVFLLFYIFAFGLRYSKINIWLALLLSIFYSALFTALDSTIVILINHFFDFDCTWISIIGLVAFIAYKYWSIRNDFK